MNKNNFFQELKRRNVYRVAITYSVVAWLVAQVVSLACSTFNAPDWVMQMVFIVLIAGFPIAVVLAWAFEMSPDGIVRTTSETFESEPSPDQNKKRITSNFFIGFLLLVITGQFVYGKYFSAKGSYSSRTEVKQPTENSRDLISSIAVFPFDVQGSPEIQYLGAGIVDLMSTQLNEIPKLNSIDPNRIFGQLEKESTISRNPEKAADLTKAFGAMKFIIGSIVQIGEDLQFSAVKYDQSGKEMTRHSVKSEYGKNLSSTINDLIKKIVADELKEANYELGNIGAVTSQNLESLKFYLEGEQALRELYFMESRELFTKAIEIDSTFALAWMRLFESFGGFRSGNELARQKWAEFRHTMPSKWQMYYEAVNLANQGDRKAIDVYNNLIRRYGDTPAFHYGLGEFKFYLNEAYGRSPTEAKAHFLKTLELDPGNQEVLVQLGQIAVLENDLESLQRALSLRNENNTRGLKVLELILKDTVTDAEIKNALNFTANVGVIWMSYFSNEEKPFHNELISRIVQQRGSLNEIRIANIIKFATTGMEEAAFEALKETGKMDLSFRSIPIHLLPRTIPASLMAVEEYLPFSEHYESLYQETKNRNTPWEIFAAIKYALALNKKKEVEELKRKLHTLVTTPQTKSMVKYFSFSLQAFEAKMAGENDKALVFIDSAYQNPIGFWETQLPYMDKSIMAATIYAEQGDYERAINYFNHSYLGIPSEYIMMGYRNYKLSQWYEAIGDYKNALTKAHIFLENYKNCDEKYQPWVEEVKKRKGRLLSQVN